MVDGWRMRFFFAELMKYKINCFDLSIQGINKDDYKKNTGVDGFNDYIQAIKNLRENNQNYKFTYVVTELNREKIVSLLEFSQKYKIDDITFEFEKGVVGESVAKLGMKECADFVKVIYDVFKNKGIKYEIATSFPLCLIQEELLERMIESKCISTACHVQGKNVLTIDPKCNLLPCSAFVDYGFDDNKVILKGADETNAFMDSYKADIFYDRTGKYPHSRCIKCKYWDLCGGGCFVRWFFEKPCDVIPDDGQMGGKLADLLMNHNIGTLKDAPESQRHL